MWRSLALTTLVETQAVNSVWFSSDLKFSLGESIYPWSFTSSDNTACTGAGDVLPVQWSDLRCHQRCVAGTNANCPDSSGFSHVGEAGTEYLFKQNSDYVCGTLTELQEMCQGLQACSGVVTGFEDGSDRAAGYLVSSCSSASVDGATYYEIGVDTDAFTCPLGVAAELTWGGAAADKPAFFGEENTLIFARDCDEDGEGFCASFSQSQPAGDASLDWDANAGSWVISAGGVQLYSSKDSVPYPGGSTPSAASWSNPAVTQWADLAAFATSSETASTTMNVDCGASWYYYPQHYCSSHTSNNLDAQYNKHPEVVRNQCHNKCRKWNTAGDAIEVVTTDLPGEVGVNGESLAHCSGNDVSFTAETDVLCLDIESCQDVARAISIVDGVDYTLDVNGYHKRCYINAHVPEGSSVCGNQGGQLVDAGALTEVTATDKTWWLAQYHDGCSVATNGIITNAEQTCSNENYATSATTDNVDTCMYQQWAASSDELYDSSTVYYRDQWETKSFSTCKNAGSSSSDVHWLKCTGSGSNVDCIKNSEIDDSALDTGGLWITQYTSRLSVSSCQKQCSLLDGCAEVMVAFTAFDDSQTSEFPFAADACFFYEAGACNEGELIDIVASGSDSHTAAEYRTENWVKAAYGQSHADDGVVTHRFLRTAASEPTVDVSDLDTCPDGTYTKKAENQWVSDDQACVLEYRSQDADYSDTCSGWSVGHNNQYATMIGGTTNCENIDELVHILNNPLEKSTHVADVDLCAAFSSEDDYNSVNALTAFGGVTVDGNPAVRIEGVKYACAGDYRPTVSHTDNAGASSAITTVYQEPRGGIYTDTYQSSAATSYRTDVQGSLSTDVNGNYPDFAFDYCYTSNGVVGNGESAAMEYYSIVSAASRDLTTGAESFSFNLPSGANNEQFVGCYHRDQATLGSIIAVDDDADAATALTLAQCLVLARAQGSLYAGLSHNGACYAISGDGSGNILSTPVPAGNDACHCDATSADNLGYSAESHACVYFAFSAFWPTQGASIDAGYGTVDYSSPFSQSGIAEGTPCHVLAHPYEVQTSDSVASGIYVDPCFTTGALGIEAFGLMCPAECATRSPYAPAGASAAAPTDEATGGSAGRRLARKLTGGDFWDVASQDFSYSHRNYEVSSVLAPICTSNSAASSQHDKLAELTDTTDWWSWAVTHASLTAETKCWTETHCGEATTCTMSQARYDAEKAYVEDGDIMEVALRSPAESFAVIQNDAYRQAGGALQNAQEIIQRVEAGASNIRVLSMGAEVDWITVTVSDGAASAPTHFAAFSDEVHVHTDAASSGSSFRVQACPTGSIATFTVATSESGATVEQDGDCVFTVTFAATSADFSFALAQQKDYCADTSQTGATACGAHSVCSTEDAATNTCACAAGFQDVNGDGTACLPSTSADIFYTFKLLHRESLSNHLDLNEIHFYADELCTQRIFGTSASTVFGAYHNSGSIADVVSGFGNWKSKYKALNIVEGTNEVITVKLANANQAVGCVRVSQTSGPSNYDLEMYASTSASSEGILIDTWSASSGENFFKFVTSCGAPETKFFGETVRFASVTGYGRFEMASNAKPCECKTRAALTNDGATSVYNWNYLNMDGKQTCFLLEEQFADGAGFYGKGQSSQPFALWTAGMGSSQVVSVSTVTNGVAGPIVPGKPFTLVLSGVNLVDPAYRARYRVKVTDGLCTDAIPAEVVGIGCSKGRDKATGGDMYTTCNSAPSAGSSIHELEFAGADGRGITIHRQKDAAEYSICACTGKSCYNPANWHKLPQSLHVAGSTYYWLLHQNSDTAESTNSVFRKTDDGATSITLTVSSPLFSQFVDPAGWEVKVISSDFSAAVDENDSLFTAGSSNVLFQHTKQFTYSLSVPVEQVGDYRVAFRTSSSAAWSFIPDHAGATSFAITKISRDTQEHSGFFHSQHLTGLAGSSNSLSIAGKNMEADMSSSRITLTTGSCSGNANFNFAQTGAAATGSTPPVFDSASSVPANGGSVGGKDNLKFCFDQPITTGDGYFIIEPDTAGYVWNQDAFACNTFDAAAVNHAAGLTAPFFAVHGSSAVVDGNCVTFSVLDAVRPVLDLVDVGHCTWGLPSAPPSGDRFSWSLAMLDANGDASQATLSGDYTLKITPGAVNSAVPNEFFNGAGSYSFSTGASSGGFLYSTYVNSQLNLYFSSGSAAALSSAVAFESHDCGTSQECSGITAAATAATVAARTASQDYAQVGVVTLDASFATTNARYQLNFAASEFTGVDADFSVDFVAGTAVGFSYANTWGVNTGASSASALAFDVSLDADVNEQNSGFEYTVCACSSSSDNSPSAGAAGSTDRYFHVAANAACADASDYISSGFVPSVAAQLCHAQCSTGGGATCSGWSSLSASEQASAFCADSISDLEALCQSQSAANAEFGSGHASCAGFDAQEQDDGSYVGFMHVASGCSTTTDESFKQFNAQTGSACTDASDYSEAVGVLKVTEKFLTGIDYIFTPGVVGSIEVLSANGNSLTETTGGADLGLSGHRVMVIDCQGTCGISEASSAVQVFDASSFNNLIPINQYYDPASDAESDAMPGVDTIVSINWSDEHSGSKCANTPISAGDAPLMREHASPYNLAMDSCKTVCAANPAACGGIDVDEISPAALCASESRFQDLCSRINHFGGSCMGYTRHAHLNYGYLYSACDHTADSEFNSKVIAESTAESRRLVAPTEFTWPLSYADVLRFPGIQTNSGGTFKVCACDHNKLSSNVCKTKADYMFEIGKLHSSGVSCLISNPRFQKTTCVSQFYGDSYRCKDVMSVGPPVVAQDSFVSQETIENIAHVASLSTYCLFQPEEVGCQTVAQWQSTYGNF